MTILFATDLSARASCAGDVAARLARAFDEPLVVAHVAEDAAATGAPSLDDEVDRLAAASSSVSGRLLDGGVVEAIEDEVRHTQPRLLVVGAQGVDVRPLLGTAASALAARVPVPVLVVRTPRHIVRFLDENRELTVLVAESMDDTFPPARDALVEIARLGPVRALVAHWSFGLEEHDDHDEHGEHARASARRKHELQAVLAREMKGALRDVPGARLDLVVRDGFGPLDVEVCDLARERDVDLIVCGTHQRRSLDRLTAGSIASGIVRDAPCSVLVAPVRGRG